MIVLMGVPGVGKTSVLRELKKRKINWRIINFGDLVLEIYKERYGVSDRDKIRFDSIERIRESQSLAMKKLEAMELDKVILDTHPSVITRKGYLPGFPFEYLSKLPVSLFILLSATPEEIFARRVFDSKRKRVADMNVIKEHLMLNISYASAYSALKGVPLSIIHNKSGELQKTVDKILEIIDIR